MIENSSNSYVSFFDDPVYLSAGGMRSLGDGVKEVGMGIASI